MTVDQSESGSLTDIKIRPAVVGDAELLAALIEELERFYGAVEIEDLAVRQPQVRQALFDSPPLAYALIA